MVTVAVACIVTLSKMEVLTVRYLTVNSLGEAKASLYLDENVRTVRLYSGEL